MPEFKAVYLKKREPKRNGKYTLFIRVTNAGIPGYISTGWDVTGDDDFDESGNLKDRKLRVMTDQKILDLEVEAKEYYGICPKETGVEMAAYFRGGKVENVDFIAHYEQFIKQMIKDDRDSWENYDSGLKHLKAFIKKDKLPIKYVTFKFLQNFEKYLTENTGERARSLALSCARKIFNDARDTYNDVENDTKVIDHYPFEKFKIVEASPKNGGRSVDSDTIFKIYQSDKLENKRDILARDIFMMIFMLGGINVIDLFYLEPANVIQGRLEYSRRKTRKKRKDNAFMSIEIPEEVKPYLEKYKDPDGVRLLDFYKRNGKYKDFLKGVNIGMKHMSKILEIRQCTTYVARHSVSVVANDDLRYPVSEVSFMLNHSSEYKTTEIYTQKKFRIVDEIIRNVINYTLYLIPSDENIRREQINQKILERSLNAEKSGNTLVKL